MKNGLTQRQKQLLEIIYNNIQSSGYPPSFGEMKQELGVSSNQSVMDLLNKLIQKRLIKREEGTARAISILPLGYQSINKPILAQILGTATAGTPTEAVVAVGEWQALRGVHDNLIQLKGELSFIKVNGDSMINAGINNGDLVLIKKQQEFISGNIVLARVRADEFTIKRFISEDKPPYVYLKPENPNYDLIPFEDDTELIGKVMFIYKNGTLIPID